MKISKLKTVIPNLFRNLQKEKILKRVQDDSRKAGFTIIELLVVITVIGIMAAGTLAYLNPLEQIRKANDARRKSDLEQVQKALDSYYQDNNAYPYSSSGNIMYNNSGTWTQVSWGGGFGAYMQTVPKDPKDPTISYTYYSTPFTTPVPVAPQSYRLYANLERGGNDPQACNTSGTACPYPTTIPGMYCGTSSSYPCNYGVSSPNASP